MVARMKRYQVWNLFADLKSFGLCAATLLLWGQVIFAKQNISLMQSNSTMSPVKTNAIGINVTQGNLSNMNKSQSNNTHKLVQEWRSNGAEDLWFWQLGTHSVGFVVVIVLSFTLPFIFQFIFIASSSEEVRFEKIMALKVLVWLLGFSYSFTILCFRFQWFNSDQYIPMITSTDQCTFWWYRLSGDILPHTGNEVGMSKAAVTIGLSVYGFLQMVCLYMDIQCESDLYDAHSEENSRDESSSLGTAARVWLVRSGTWVISALIGSQQSCVLLPLTAFDVRTGRFEVPTSQTQATCFHKYAVAGIPVGIPMMCVGFGGLFVAHKMCKSSDSCCMNCCAFAIAAASSVPAFTGLGLFAFWAVGGMGIGLWFTFGSATELKDLAAIRMFDLAVISSMFTISGWTSSMVIPMIYGGSCGAQSVGISSEGSRAQNIDQVKFEQGLALELGSEAGTAVCAHSESNGQLVYIAENQDSIIDGPHEDYNKLYDIAVTPGPRQRDGRTSIRSVPFAQIIETQAAVTM